MDNDALDVIMKQANQVDRSLKELDEAIRKYGDDTGSRGQTIEHLKNLVDVQATVAQKLTSIADQMANLDATKLSNSIDNIKTKLSDIAQTESKIDGLANDVGNLSSQLTKITDSINAIDERIDRLQANMRTINHQVERLGLKFDFVNERKLKKYYTN